VAEEGGVRSERSRAAAAAAVESYPVLLHAKAITLREAMPALVDVLGPQACILTPCLD
jgi:hypothetical protein